MSPPQIAKFLENSPEWTSIDSRIERVVRFPTYLEGVDFVRAIAEMAETINHHPDLILSWRKVTIQLTTHSENGVTQRDLDMAGKINTLVD